MTEAQFISAIEKTGARDVWVMRKPQDAGAKLLGVGVSFMRDGELKRSAVRIPSGDDEAVAFDALLVWAEE